MLELKNVTISHNGQTLMSGPAPISMIFLMSVRFMETTVKYER